MSLFEPSCLANIRSNIPKTGMLAPIVLFVFARPDHTRRTVDALKQNELAQKSDLFIFSDAPKSEAQAGAVREVRQYIRRIEGFKSVSIVERETNFGLSRSIIEGVTSIVNQQSRVIVLEDDLITSPHFLAYMNQALDTYSDDDRVASIHGYVYPVKAHLPDAFFMRGADCWGWATWQWEWAQFNPDGQYLLDELRRRELLEEFDFNGAYLFSKMLEDQIKGKNDSWAVRWHASAFLADKLTLYPGHSLVHNIGNDVSGTHCGDTTQFDTALSEKRINLVNITVERSEDGRRAFEKFFRRPQNDRQRLVQKALSGKTMKSIKAVAKGWLPPAMFRWARWILLGGRL